MRNCASTVGTTVTYQMPCGKRPPGLGDSVEYVLKRVGVHDWITKNWKMCKCQRRKAWLNTVFPYDIAIWKERFRRIMPVFSRPS